MSSMHPSHDALEETVPAEPGARSMRVGGGEPLVRGVAVGRYTVLDRIGAGGMGVVYAAFDPELDRRIALKVLHASGVPEADGTLGRNRLLREAQAMAKLHHPNVITVHDVGTFGDRVFVAMEFVDGATLREWTATGVHEWAEIVDVFIRAGRGLAAAHAVGLVHRDFKPDNVLVGNDGRVLVMDFGLARQAGTTAIVEAPRSPASTASGASEAILTRTGAVLGTPAYMAPEQHAGATIGAAADQFSFCVALYEALWGERPFTGNSVASLALAVMETAPRRPPRDSQVPAWLFDVLVRGLAPDPNDRFASMDALLAELQRDPAPTSHPALTIGIALGVAGLIVTGYLALREDPQTRCATDLAAVQALVSPERAEAATRAFEASGVPHAPTVWGSARARLDAYDAAWREQWRAACEIGHARPAEAEAMAIRRQCLDDLRTEATALLDAFATDASPGVVDDAVDAVLTLEPPASCGAPSGQQRASASGRGEARRAVVDARTLLRTGRADATVDRLSGFIVTPVPLEDRAVEAELLTLHGRAEQRIGRDDVARTSLRRAVVAAAAVDNARLEQDAWLAILRGMAQGPIEDAAVWSVLAATESAIVRAGDLVDARRRWLVAFGDLDASTGAPRDALDHYDRAVSLGGEPADPLVDAALAQRRCIALGGADLRDGTLDTCRGAVDAFAAVLGPSHPAVAAALADLAIEQAARGELGPAAATLERARLAVETDSAATPRAMADGAAPQWLPTDLPTHPALAVRIFDRIGVVERDNERFTAAAAWHAAAAALAIRTRDRAAGYALVNLGVALLDLGRPAEALAQLQRGVDRLALDLDEDHPDLVVARLDRANALCGVGQWSAAAAEYQSVADRWEQRLPADHPRLAYALTGLARARLELDDASAAIDPLEHALELRSDAREDELNLAETSWLLARALLASGADEARAIDLATRALIAVRAPPIQDPLELRRLLAGGTSPGITDKLTPASLVLVDRTAPMDASR
jgi:tetratricopeptide (TPR) repeat protein/predicted Ser/Thr protein kinase